MSQCRWPLLLLASCVGMADLGGEPPAMTVTDGGPQPMPMPMQPDAGTADAGAPDAGPRDAGAADPCAAVQCGANARCVAGQCGCNPGFIADGGACLAGDPGIPALRSETQVCEAYRRGLVVSAPQPFTKTAATCDPGTLSRGGLDDALGRLNMYRYLSGIGPVSDSASQNTSAQACSLVSAWNPAGQAAHSPPPTATCYTPEGASGAGSSNIAWGPRSPGGAIDQWMEDYGNDTTFGHRRWLLNPPLGPVGVGYYEGGNNYGSASCITVFNSSGGGPRPAVISWPPPGFVPVQLVSMAWTAQGDVPFQDAGIVITGATGTPYAATLYILQGSYGGSGALRIDRNGWAPRAGETYRVTLTGEGHAPVQYEVKPIDCP